MQKTLHLQILGNQLTLYQPGRANYTHHITTGTLKFSDFPMALICTPMKIILVWFGQASFYLLEPALNTVLCHLCYKDIMHYVSLLGDFASHLASNWTLHGVWCFSPWECVCDYLVKCLNSEISVLHDFNVGKSVSNSQNLLAGSTAVLLETLF